MTIATFFIFSQSPLWSFVFFQCPLISSQCPLIFFHLSLDLISTVPRSFLMSLDGFHPWSFPASLDLILSLRPSAWLEFSWCPCFFSSFEFTEYSLLFPLPWNFQFPLLFQHGLDLFRSSYLFSILYTFLTFDFFLFIRFPHAFFMSPKTTSCYCTMMSSLDTVHWCCLWCCLLVFHYFLIPWFTSSNFCKPLIFFFGILSAIQHLSSFYNALDFVLAFLLLSFGVPLISASLHYFFFYLDPLIFSRPIIFSALKSLLFSFIYDPLGV